MEGENYLFVAAVRLGLVSREGKVKHKIYTQRIDVLTREEAMSMAQVNNFNVALMN